VDPLIAQIRECFGRVVYSHKIHEKCSDIYHGRLAWLKIWQIVLSALTTGSLLTALVGNDKIATVVAAALSTVLLVLNAYTKNYDLGGLAQQHSDAASKLWEVRESYFSLLTDAETGRLKADEIIKIRDKLQEKLAAIYKGAPRTSSKAYAQAQEGLKNEELTFSGKEIDMFLPKPLRKAVESNSETGTNSLLGKPVPQSTTGSSDGK
jgi:hypothetical protein